MRKTLSCRPQQIPGRSYDRRARQFHPSVGCNNKCSRGCRYSTSGSSCNAFENDPYTSPLSSRLVRRGGRGWAAKLEIAKPPLRRISDEHERNHFRFGTHSLLVDVRSTCRPRTIKFKDLCTFLCNALQVAEPQKRMIFLARPNDSRAEETIAGMRGFGCDRDHARG